MLELLGSGYVIEHCIAAFSDYQHRKSFETYVTDCLKYITGNTAIPEKTYMTERFCDLAYKTQKKADNRTGEQIISSLKNKIEKIKAEGGESHEFA